MIRKKNTRLVPFARELRSEMTKEEKHLWYDFLRGHSGRFQKQKILGKYIVDFYSARATLVIELDGSQHYDAESKQKDEARTKFLEGYHLKVIRIPNNAITQNFQGVCEYLDKLIEERMKANLE